MCDARLAIDAGDARPERVEQLHGLLLSDLRAVPGAAVRRARSEPPAGAKSAGQLAELVISGALSGGTIAAIAKVLTAWIKRTDARSVTWKEGEDEFVFTGMAKDDQQRFIEFVRERQAGPKKTDVDS